MWFNVYLLKSQRYARTLWILKIWMLVLTLRENSKQIIYSVIGADLIEDEVSILPKQESRCIWLSSAFGGGRRDMNYRTEWNNDLGEKNTRLKYRSCVMRDDTGSSLNLTNICTSTVNGTVYHLVLYAFAHSFCLLVLRAGRWCVKSKEKKNCHFCSRKKNEGRVVTWIGVSSIFYSTALSFFYSTGRFPHTA